MKHVNLLSFCLCIGLFFQACDKKVPEEEKDTAEKTGEIKETPPVQVEVEVLKQKPFNHEIISNGKLEGSRIAELRLNGSGLIKRVYVHNGQYVKKGQLVAKIEDREPQNALLQARISWEDSKISLADYLIGLGYDIQDTVSVPQEILRSSKIRSGFSRAQRELDMARYKLAQTSLYAPIRGIVSGLETKENTYTSSGEAFCKIIDNTSFEVRFPVVESEASLVAIGDSVKIIPYYDKQKVYTGVLSGLDPIVDESGLVEVTAALNSNGKDLLEGMNVKIEISQELGDYLMVPKEAITLRSEREVVFVYRDGKSMWNYVETGLENSSQKIIKEGLQPGDSIIVKGGLHLAHESPVTVSKVWVND